MPRNEAANRCKSYFLLTTCVLKVAALSGSSEGGLLSIQPAMLAFLVWHHQRCPAGKANQVPDTTVLHHEHDNYGWQCKWGLLIAAAYSSLSLHKTPHWILAGLLGQWWRVTAAPVCPLSFCGTWILQFQDDLAPKFVKVYRSGIYK